MQNVNFNTDTNKLNIAVYPYRKKLYLEDNEFDLKLSEYKSLWAKTSLSTELLWHIFQTMHCTGWKNYSKVKQNPSRRDVFFIMSILRLSSKLKLSFDYKSARKNLCLVACFSWNSRLPLSEMDQKFGFGGTIGYSDSCLEFLIPHCKAFRLRHMQYFMILLEQ